MGDAPERIWAADQKYAEGIEGSWHVDRSIYGGVEYVCADTITALEAENKRLREALIRIEDLTSHNMGMSDREERVVNKQACAALEGE